MAPKRSAAALQARASACWLWLPSVKARRRSLASSFRSWVYLGLHACSWASCRTRSAVTRVQSVDTVAVADVTENRARSPGSSSAPQDAEEL